MNSLSDDQERKPAEKKAGWRDKLKTIWPSLFSVVVLLIFVVYLYLNADQFKSLLDLSILSILMVIGLVLISIGLKGLVNYLLYREMGASSIRVGEGVGLAVINTVSNQLPFAGGLIAKGVYLKKRYQVAYTQYVSATLAVYVCYVSSTGMVGLGVLGYWYISGGEAPLSLALGFLGMAASISLLWIPLNFAFLPRKWQRRALQLADGWKILQQNPVLVLELVGLQIALTVLAAGRLWITFHALSQDVTMLHCMLFSSASILTRLVSISPGGFGVREGIIAGIASVLGFDLGVSAVAVGLERLITTPVNIVLGIGYAYFLGKEAIDVPSEPGSADPVQTDL
jgi:uncharacterized membrane protein YbhN (UPF0104 family)